MQDRPTGAESGTDTGTHTGALPGRFYDRLWLFVLALVPWLIQPGRVQPDTKVDLTLDVWAYLRRSLTAWNPHGGLGELQNQAYGYLFPMGPVYGVGHSLGLPAWAVQRVWWMLLIVVAFTGVRRLIRTWGVAGPTASMIGATAYALSPRVLTLLSDHSVEAWPGAVAPWLLLAAGAFTDPTSTRRGRLATVARVGLLVAALGGVNAAASAIAIVPAVLLLAVHPVGRRRLPWLVLGVLLGAAWWVLPLVVLGAYAYPFLSYIETASITTAVTSVPNTLRGADNWIAYILDDQSHPSWQGGWVIAQSVSAIVLTCAVAALGVVGLLRTGGVVRHFGLVSVVLGTLLMVVGHPGFAGSPIAQPVRDLLDGPLVVFRNVHKFDLLLRLPLSIGLAALAAALAHRARRPLLERRVAAGAVGLVVVAAMVPLWQGRAGSDASYVAVPASWRAAAAQVDRLDADGGTALLLPSSRTASYTWGRSTDEPLTALAKTPVVVRASAPLGHPVATRLLDAIDALAASGTPQPALADTMASAGIRTVVVRRDLAANAGAGSWRNVERTLAASPGFRQVTAAADAHRSLWTVAGRAPAQTTHTVVIAGGPEALAAARSTGLVSPDASVVLAADVRQPAQLVTDSLAWQAYHNGAPAQRAYGPVLPVSDTSPSKAGSLALPPVVPAEARPHRVLLGLRDVTVSSSAADPFAPGYVSVAHSQFAAIDGDETTSWLTGAHEAAATFELRFTQPVRATTVTLRFATGRGVTRPASVVVGGVSHRVDADTMQLQMPVVGDALRIQLRAPEALTDPVMGLSEVAVAGRSIGSIVQVPTPVDLRSGALLLGADVTSTQVPSRAGEDGAGLRRRVTVSAAASTPLSVWLRGGSAVSDESSCGAAGFVTVGGQRVPLHYVGAASGGVRRAESCSGDVDVAAGTFDVVVHPASGASVEHLALGRPPVGTAQTLRTTTHGANAGWSGTVGGRPAVGVTVDGWRQAYVQSSPGAVTETFGPTTWHRAGLSVGAALVLLLAVLALVTRGERPRLDPATPLGAPSASRWRAWLPPLVVGGLAAGPVGALLGGLASWVPRRHRPFVAGGALVLAGLALAFGGVVDQRSWGAGVGQVLGTVTLVLLAAQLPDRSRPRTDPWPAQE